MVDCSLQISRQKYGEIAQKSESVVFNFNDND